MGSVPIVLTLLADCDNKFMHCSKAEASALKLDGIAEEEEEKEENAQGVTQSARSTVSTGTQVHCKEDSAATIANQTALLSPEVAPHGSRRLQPNWKVGGGPPRPKSKERSGASVCAANGAGGKAAGWAAGRVAGWAEMVRRLISLGSCCWLAGTWRGRLRRVET